MLPTDAHCDYMAKLNIIQNALQKVDVYLSHEQAVMVYTDLSRELTVDFRLRRKDKSESGKPITSKQSTKSCKMCKRVDKSGCDTASAELYDNCTGFVA
jgi:hypothetical protein